ncbi:MAG: pyridoxal phosphate-dependent aminotransferase [Planctomycetes bacterium]|nr:pyridoxal phosphate-dependent aminotransferase [Planctomycetota bacterium]
MDFEPFQYMRFAKRLEYADGIFMAGSGMYRPKADLLKFKESDFTLESLCSNYGDPRNVAWLAEHYATSGENVALTAGSSEANFLVFAALLHAGDKVIVESPGYPQFSSLASLVGAEVVKLPRRFEDGFQPDLDEFKKLLDDSVRLVVLTNLHNPSMARMSPEVMREIAAAAAEVGAKVLVDEVYLDHLRPGEGDESALKAGENVVVTSSLTKVYGLSGLRFGWAVGPKKLVSKMLDLADVVDPELSTVAQNMAHRALENLSRLRPVARRLHERNWPVVKEWLESREDVEYYHPPGGITVWMKVNGVEETGNLATVARQDYGVLVVPGEYFQSPGWLRVGYKIEPTSVREGLSRLGKAIDDFKSH